MNHKCTACNDDECACPTEHRESYLYRMFGSLFPAVHGEGGSYAIRHATELPSAQDVEEQIEEDHKGG